MVETILVKLYTHKGCLGGNAARNYLDAQGVPYQVRDVSTEKESRAEFRQLGGIGTPLLHIGRLLMHGFDPVEFERLVAVAGEGSTSEYG